MAVNGSFISSGICDDCTRLVRDVLSGNTYHNENWMTLSSEYATLSVATHLDGSVESLQKSWGAGCKLCELISHKLPESPVQSARRVYSIFVWQVAVAKTASKARFQIATQAVETFVRHVSNWRKPPSLTIFGQRSVSLSPEKPLEKGEWSAPIGPPCVSLMPASHHNSPENFCQAEKWLQECRSNHPRCFRTKPPPLPNRVVHLEESNGDIRISLCVTKGKLGRYTAVSYSWGESDRLVTMQEPKTIPPEAKPRNGTYVIEQRSPQPGQHGVYEHTRFWDPADIPLNAFPATLKDAILIAHKLGFQYIWIDSLCIVQDSKSDWADQVAELTYIYSGAELVISAADSETGTSGILNEIPIPNTRIKVGKWWMDTETYEVYVGDPVKVLDLERKFLSTRGWVFQERLVSTASLHYTNEGLVWECAHGIQASHDQDLYSVSWKSEWNNLLQESNFSPSDQPLTRPLSKTPNEMWYNWTNAYSARDLYDKSDKFPAFAGIARRFAQAFRLTYVAGLWKEDFIRGLTWVRHNRTPTLTRYRDKYVAPSWSWGSVQGRLEHRNIQLIDSTDERKGPTLKVLQYNVKEARALTDGQRSYEALLRGATIKVSGCLQPITVDIHYQPGPRIRPFQHCGVSGGFLNNKNVVCTLDEYDTSLPFDEVPRFYKCWCLRVGSYQSGRREGDMFLLLDREEGKQDFHRVGFAETDPYLDIKTPTPCSGIFESVRNPTTIIIA